MLGPTAPRHMGACKCKTKATLLASRRLTRKEMHALERLPFGAKTLAHHAKSLGMTLIGAPTFGEVSRRANLEASRLSQDRYQGAVGPKVQEIFHRLHALLEHILRPLFIIRGIIQAANTYCNTETTGHEKQTTEN